MAFETRFSRSASYHLSHRAQENSFRLQARAVLERLGEGEAPVLDLGCGTGPLIPDLLLKDRHPLGIDLDLPMLMGARARCGPRVALADAARLPLRRASLGAVVSLGLFEYLSDPVGVLKGLWVALKPRGRVHLTVPHPTAPYRRALRLVNPVVEMLRRRDDPFDLRSGSPPDRDTVTRWAAESGFRVDTHSVIAPHALPWPFDILFPRLAENLARRCGPRWATVQVFSLARLREPS